MVTRILNAAASIRLACVMAGVFVWVMWEMVSTSHHYDLIDHGP